MLGTTGASAVSGAGSICTAVFSSFLTAFFCRATMPRSLADPRPDKLG